MKINKKVSLLIQIFIGIFLILTFFFVKEEGESIFLSSSLYWIPFLSYIIFIVGLILEYFSGDKPIIRTIILSVSLILSLIVLKDSLNLFAISLILFGIPYEIALVIGFIRKGFTISQSNIAIKKTLPEGVFNKKDIIIQYIIYGFLFVAFFTIALIFNMNKINVLYTLLFFPFAVIIVFFVSIKFNSMRKILNSINKELDIEKFNTLIEQTLKNNLHPESYNYLLLVKANYYLDCDQEVSIKLFEQTHRPNNKKKALIYDVLEIEILITLKKYAEALEKINKLPNIYKPTLQNYYSLYASNEEISNIEILFITNSKVPFTNLNSIFSLMYYYETRLNHDKALKYADKILEYNTKFEYMNKLAKDVINNCFSNN